MTNKELSVTIRAELKAAGFTSKDYSIRVSDCGYSTSVHITIKNVYVRKSAIENIVNKHELVRREERTYETLEGCNTYVSVQYETGLFDSIIPENLAAAKEELESFKNDKTASCMTIQSNGKSQLNIGKCDDDLFVNEFSEHWAPSYTISTPEELSVYIWKYENLGTIAA